jgi:hypothetical protein
MLDSIRQSVHHRRRQYRTNSRRPRWCTRHSLTMTWRGRTGFVIFGACELLLSASLALSSSRAAALLAQKEALERKYDAQYYPESSHLDFYSEK